MKQEVVPTSPKSEHRQEQAARAAERRAQGTVSTAMVVVVISAGIGVLTGLFGFYIASVVPPEWPVIGKLNVVALFEKERQEVLLSTRTQERSAVEKAPQIIDEIVALYSDEPTLDAPAEFVGNAIVLSADGWMATPTSVLDALQNEEQEGEELPVVVLPNDESATIQNRIDDAVAGMTYFQVDASSLNVVNFAESTAVAPGQQLSLIEKQIGSFVVYERRAAGEVNRENTIRRTTELEQFAVLDPSDQINRTSVPVFASNGDILGMVLDGGIIVPAPVIQGGFQSLVIAGAENRSTIDIEYININRLTDTEKAARALPENGILITTVHTIDTGLEAEDVITSINNVPVSANTDLGAAVHSTTAGEALFVEVLRAGENQYIDILVE